MTTTRILGGALLCAAALALPACGSSSSKTSAASGGGTTTTAAAAAPSTSAAPSASTAPGASLSVANVTGLGSALVDGRGHTVYVLTADGKTSLPCEDSTGCTKAWPDVALPDGVSAAKAGTGVDASLLGTKKVGTETYVTYNGWLLYEFVKDTDAGQGHGEGIKSFGGTWYALDAKGAPITAASAAASSTTMAPAGGSGY
jgi:predicted lipoprotein with Yx(FWY)xxD motif